VSEAVGETEGDALAGSKESGKVRPAHYDLKQGSHDPELNKTVEHVILATDDFVVYLDLEMDVQWHSVDGYEPPEHCGDVLSRATILEAQSSFIKDKVRLCGVRRLVAEAIAQCMHKQPRSASNLLLREAEQKLEARNKEVSWQWYFTAAYITTGVSILLVLGMWLFRPWFVKYLGNTGVEVILGALCGPLGALLSATSRANRLVMDANAGRNIHQFEGLCRIGVGIVGALFVALAIKGGLIMGGMTFQGSPLALMLALCVAAGASERLVPSLVVAFEKLAVSQGAQKPLNSPT
jgi:hypothetical protein